MLRSLTALVAFCRRGEASRRYDASTSSRCTPTNGVLGRFPCCADLAIRGGRLQLRVRSDCSQSVKATLPWPDASLPAAIQCWQCFSASYPFPYTPSYEVILAVPFVPVS